VPEVANCWELQNVKCDDHHQPKQIWIYAQANSNLVQLAFIEYA